MADKRDIINELVKLKCIKIGEFKLKSGLTSKYYINLREIPNKTDLLIKVAQEMIKLIPKEENDNLLVVGVPNGAVPLATALAISSNKNQLFLGKEKKNHGFGDCIVPGNYKYLIVEDVMTTGSSILETIERIGGEKVTQVMVIVDRESGGVDNIKAQYPHIVVISLLKVSDMEEYLI